MTAADSVLLQELPGWAFAFVLVLARVGSACMLLPGIGEVEVPATIRAGFATSFSLLLLPVLQPLVPNATDLDLGSLMLVAAEVVAGLWLGWLTRLVMLALPMAGQIIASMIGLANVLQPDSQLGPQSSALARLFSLAAPVALMAGGLHAVPLAALAGSYTLIPLGTGLPPADSAQAVIAAVAESFSLALRLSAPFVLAAIVWNVALGMLTRLVPQLQIFFAAMPGQIIGGLLLLGLLGGTILTAWLDSFRTSLTILSGP